MMDARWPRGGAPGGLVMSGGLDMRVLPGLHQRVIWRSGVRPDAYLGIDTGLKTSKHKFPGWSGQEQSFLLPQPS